MKQLILAAIGLLCLMQLAQAQSVDQRIIDALGQQRAQDLSPDSLAFYQYIVDNGYVILDDLPQEKRQLLPQLSTLTLKDGSSPYQSLGDLTNFNRLLVKEPTNERMSQTFQIPNTDKALALPSRFQLKLMAADE